MIDALLWSGRALAMLALHGGALIALVWLLESSGVLRTLAIREWFWRCAVFAGLVSASLQLAVVEPLTGHWATATNGPGAVVDAGAESPWIDDSVAALPHATNKVAISTGATQPAPATAVSTTAPANALISPVSRLAAQWPLIVLALWLAAAALRTVALMRSAKQLRTLRRQARPLHRHDVIDDARNVAQTMQIAAPQIAAVDAIDSPMALPGRLVLLPEWASRLPSSQRCALLAHEFAHVQRRDPEWRIALAGWRALACGIPGLGIALRRLDHLAELHCDDASARHTGEPHALAECLAQVLDRQHRHHPVPAFAAAMATPHSPVLQRAERLLEGVPVSDTPLSWKLRATPLLAIATAVLLIPSLLPIAITPAQASIFDGVSLSLHIDDDDGDMRVKLRRDGLELNFRSSGKITFNEDESDIASLAPGASAMIEETVAGLTRRIDFALADGVITRRYQRAGKDAPLDTEARQWLAAVTPSLLRETAINAEARVGRLYKSGGAKAVLDEIDRMQSGHARGRYLATLLPMATLSDDELRRAITLAGGIDSDHERAKALTALLKQRPLDAGQKVALLEQARQIGSDHELSELLQEATPNPDEADVVQDAWFKAVEQIGSDHEHQQVLMGLLLKPDADNRRVSRVLAEMGTIGSDHSKGELLHAIAAATGNADAIAPAYAKAIGDIGSDHEQGEAASALIAAKGFGAVSTRELLTVATNLGSDHSCTELLVELAAVMPVDETLINDYRKAASRLPDHNRGEVERALDRRRL